MIDIIPFRTKRLTTKLTVQELAKRIEQLLDKHTDLIGYTEKNGFIIERKIQYQNPFKPIVRGVVNENSGETQVTIRYRPKAFVLIFYMTIIGAMVYGAFKFPAPGKQFIVLASVLFLILMIGFNVERNKIEKRIKDQIK